MRRGPGDVRLNGTNDGTERTVHLGVKGRSRTMRTCRRRESVRNASNLICYPGYSSSDVSVATLLST